MMLKRERDNMKFLAVILAFSMLPLFCSKDERAVEGERPLAADEAIAAVREEVDGIRGMTLHKLTFGKPEPGSVVEDVYLDRKGRIRRLVNRGGTSPAVFRWVKRIEYFGESGDIVHLLFVYYDQPLTGSRGSAFFAGGNAVRTSAFSAGGDAVRRLEAPPRGYDRTAAGIVKRLGIDGESARRGKKVILGPPAKDDVAVINTNDVVIRSTPSRTGKKMNVYRDDGGLPKSLQYSVGAHVFSTARVLEVGPEETIEPWGTHRWYRVTVETPFASNVTGWLFGGFLEPVER